MSMRSSMETRLEAGEAIEVSEIVSRLDELENRFDDRGFVYIAVNGWLISSLDGDHEARELMFLRAVHEILGTIDDGRVILASDAVSEAGTFIGRLNGRYVPDGYLYSVTAPEADRAVGRRRP